MLLAYFSRPGENYYYGDRITLEVGNTQLVADMIAAAAKVDVYRIEAADPYPDDYEATVARNVREEDSDARPAVANPLPALAPYDTVLIAGAHAFTPHHYTPGPALPPGVTVLQLDSDPDEIGRNFPADTGLVGALAPSLSQPAASLQISWGKADRSCGSELPARAPCAMPDCTPAVTCSAPRVRPRPAAESARTSARCHETLASMPPGAC